MPKGTHLIDFAGEQRVYKKGPGLSSLDGSTEIANDFNFANAVYKQKQDIANVMALK